ncbi:MAG TPA: AraD1 family protein [Terracidiphilus sp.]|jgi:hypothetical protein
MTAHLVQITDGAVRRIALVNEPNLHCLADVSSIYSVAQRCLRDARSLEDYVWSAPVSETVLYDDIYLGRSQWRLLPPIDVPDQPSRLLVSGTGLTHVGSARQRQSMHLAKEVAKSQEVLTDSMRMFRWGLESGCPKDGTIGVAPEWFYKGDGSIVRAPFEELEIPGHAEDGGEEAELAGVYIVADNGLPYRVGFVQGNEFSDHIFEKRNYLNLAGSKLRTCSIGPELIVGASFADVHGEVRIQRDNTTLWKKHVASGERNMCHSVANIEHHHFKFAGHRQPGSVHIHFFGADALSFGEGIALQEGDIVEINFDDFGRALRNSIRTEAKSSQPIRVGSL